MARPPCQINLPTLNFDVNLVTQQVIFGANAAWKANSRGYTYANALRRRFAHTDAGRGSMGSSKSSRATMPAQRAHQDFAASRLMMTTWMNTNSVTNTLARSERGKSNEMAGIACSKCHWPNTWHGTHAGRIPTRKCETP